MSVQLAIMDPVFPTGQDTKTELREHSDTPSVLFLSLDDLVPDDTGSIVVLAGGNNLILSLGASEEVVDRGVAAPGSRSELFDLSGMDYCEFAGGTKLFYTQDEVRLILREE